VPEGEDVCLAGFGSGSGSLLCLCLCLFEDGLGVYAGESRDETCHADGCYAAGVVLVAM